MDNTKKKILIVDDEVELANTIKTRLEAVRDYTISMAHDGQAGLEAIVTDRPDLLILDINLPKINGIELYKKICGDDMHPDFPVLVLTVRGELEDFFEGLNVDGFISKPFKLDEVLKEIDRILSALAKPCLFLMDTDKGTDTADVKARMRQMSFKVFTIDSMDVFKIVALKQRPDFIVIKVSKNPEGTKGLIADIKTFITKIKELNKRTDIPSVLASRIWPLSHKVGIIAYAEGPVLPSCDAAFLGADVYVSKAEDVAATINAAQEKTVRHRQEKEEEQLKRMTRPGQGRPKITDLDIFKF
ncbi:MAG: response regulator [Candidatus Omnitrophica bacterium]|nr:response regulator [Candidatus Omnitrophota bacterium]